MMMRHAVYLAVALCGAVLVFTPTTTHGQQATESQLDAFFGGESPIVETPHAQQPASVALSPPKAPPTSAAPPLLATTRDVDGADTDAGGAFFWHDVNSPKTHRELSVHDTVFPVGHREATAARKLLASPSGYDHPVVMSMSATKGPVEGYTQIFVVGTYFHSGLSSSYKCKFGQELSLHPIVVLNSTHLTCRSARHAAGVTAFTIVAPSSSTFIENAKNFTFEFQPSLFVADFKHHSVLRFNADTGDFVDTFVQAGSGGLKGPYGMAFGLDSNFYVASQKTSSVLQYHGGSGAFQRKFCTVPGEPRGLVFHLMDLYVTSALYDRVYRYNGYTGSPRGVFIDGGLHGVDVPWGIIFDKYSNNTYISSQDTGLIHRFQPPAMGLYGGIGAARHDKVWSNVRTPLINGIDLTWDSMYAVGPEPGKVFVRFNRTNGEYMHHFEDEDLMSPTDIKEFKDYIYITSEGTVRKYNRLNGEYIRTHANAGNADLSTLLFTTSWAPNKGE